MKKDHDAYLESVIRVRAALMAFLEEDLSSGAPNPKMVEMAVKVIEKAGFIDVAASSPDKAADFLAGLRTFDEDAA